MSNRTVTKWFDSGRLKGYRIPGSKDRRVPADALVRFLTDHRVPIPPELSAVGDVSQDVAAVTPTTDAGITQQELKVLEYTAGLWNAYLMLPDIIDEEATVHIREAVHHIQGQIAIRVARRVNPEAWR